MNKSDLIKELACKADLSLAHSERIVEKFFDSIVATLAKGERVEIRGFGAFTSRTYKAYEGRNPATGERIKIPEKQSPFFRSGDNLRKRLNGVDV